MIDIKLGSLFDGVAVFPLAAKRNGIKAAWASEIEVFPLKVSQYHFPDMKHLGDICLINGAEIEPVDIITFGSPCQDLSVAGKREGMAGERSGLFSQAIRIIREMQGATNGEYPRYAIWENVPGAFSSNSGQDFRTVLEEITASEIPMPKSGKWANAGMVRGNGYSVAWRTLDAQYWGVPQRRKRIFLVTDFRGQRAPEILFECEGLPWNFTQSREAREEPAGRVRNGVETTSRINCTSEGIAGTVSSKWAKGTGGPAGDKHYSLVCQPIAFNGRQDPVYGQVTGAIDTDRATQCVLHPKVAGTICASGAGTNRPAGQGNETDLVFVIQSATMSGDKKQNGLGVSDGPCYTLDCRADHAVAHSFPLVGHGVYLEGGAATLRSFHGDCGGGSETLVTQNYMVRRLMPIECERLMSMPDGWTNIPGASDTARYKSIGNSLVMNIADWIFSQIVRIEIEEMLG